MQLLQPLTFQYVGFAARQRLGVPRVHHVDLESVAFKNLKQSKPVNSCCLHDDCLDPTSLQPNRHSVQVGGEAAEFPYRFAIPSGGYCYVVFRIANINASCVPIQHGKAILPSVLLRSFTPWLLLLLHTKSYLF
jgi:hypothetical protein